MADSLTETIELLLGVAVVLFMFLYVPWYGLEPTFGSQPPALAGIPVVLILGVVSRLVALVGLAWMIRIYIRPDDEGGRARLSRSRGPARG